MAHKLRLAKEIIWRKPRAHIKFIEAVAVIVALVAWGLEASSVKRWDRGILQFIESGNVTQNNYQVRYLDADVHLMAASTQVVTRTPGTNLEKPYTSFFVAWESPEFRVWWYQQVFVTTQRTHELLDLILSTHQRYQLGFEPKYDELAFRNSQLEREIAAVTDRGYLTDIYPATLPNPVAFNARDAIAFRNTQDQLSLNVGTLQVETLEKLQSGASRALQWHRRFFISAAFILLLAKVLEWIVELKSKTNHASAS
jgi:hypothetical protein